MSTYAFKLPDIGEGIAESEIAAWRVAEGESIKEDQPLVDMLTDKAAVEIPSPVAGKVVKLHAAAGDKVPVGSVLVTIETSDALVEEKAATSAPAPKTPTATAPTVTTPAVPARADDGFHNPQPTAAPSVRRRARELGVDLHQTRGSGPSGRVLHEDLECSTNGSGTVARSAPEPDKIEQIKIIGMRRKIAESMERSKRRIPHFAYVEEVDVTELEALRLQLNDTYGKQRGKLTLLPFLMQALVKVIPEFPQVNSTYDDEAGVASRYSSLHIGIATQTPNGLIVPVVRNAERLDLWQSGREVARLAEAARTGKATRTELSGSTITITSLGKMGGIASTPVINAPEVAIIGVNKMVERPMVVKGQVVIRMMMNLSSSFDHRIVDGYDAASFIQRLKALLEQPALLFVA